MENRVSILEYLEITGILFSVQCFILQKGQVDYIKKTNRPAQVLQLNIGLSRVELT